MSAFGRKNGPAGAKPGFGIARPMQGGGTATKEELPVGGDQFPPLDIASLPGEAPFDPLAAPTSQMQRNADAIQRLSDRTKLECARSVDVGRSGGLGQAVAFQNDYISSGKKFSDFF